MSYTMLSTFTLLRMSGFLWRSNLVSPNIGLKNLICAASSFWASLLFMTQFSLPRHKLALEVILYSPNFVSVVTFPEVTFNYSIHFVISL
jgi:hypothetical protein